MGYMKVFDAQREHSQTIQHEEVQTVSTKERKIIIRLKKTEIGIVPSFLALVILDSGPFARKYTNQYSSLDIKDL
jgi:hypothetical protein